MSIVSRFFERMFCSRVKELEQKIDDLIEQSDDLYEEIYNVKQELIKTKQRLEDCQAALTKEGRCEIAKVHTQVVVDGLVKGWDSVARRDAFIERTITSAIERAVGAS